MEKIKAVASPPNARVIAFVFPRDHAKITTCVSKFRRAVNMKFHENVTYDKPSTWLGVESSLACYPAASYSFDIEECDFTMQHWRHKKSFVTSWMKYIAHCHRTLQALYALFNEIESR